MMTVCTNIFKIDNILLKNYINFVCTHEQMCYGMPVEVRVQFVSACCLSLPHGSWGLNLGYEA